MHYMMERIEVGKMVMYNMDAKVEELAEKISELIETESTGACARVLRMCVALFLCRSYPDTKLLRPRGQQPPTSCASTSTAVTRSPIARASRILRSSKGCTIMQGLWTL